jgi:hypothetical protein
LNVFVELQQLSANHSTFYLHADGNVAKKFDSTVSLILMCFSIALISFSF